jgi:hypothetical protein
MKPVRTAWTEIVYRGPSADVGDLCCHRIEPGVIASVWEPDEEELRLLAEGGRVRLVIWGEPIPPVSVDVLSAGESQPVGENRYREIAELDDPERSP